MSRAKIVQHAANHRPGGPDPVPVGPVDSTETVGDTWGVHSDGPSPTSYFLRPDGAGGSKWAPGDGSFSDRLQAVLAGSTYAWYKLDEATGDWADSSGGSRTLASVTRTGELRGVSGLIDEGDGALGVYTTGSRGAGVTAAPIGSRNDSFFKFAGVAPFSVLFGYDPDFSAPGGVFSFGVLGSLSGTNDGWGVFIEPTTNRIDFRRGTSTSANERLRSVAQVFDPSVVVCVWDGTHMLIYINGALDASSTPASPHSITASSSDPFTIGGCGIHEGVGGTWAPSVGTQDSVVVVDRALTASEVGSLTQAASPLFAIAPSDSVVSETAFGQAATAGVGVDYSRGDHTHGTPPTPTSVSGNAGTATALQTGRTIDGVTFDGTGNITLIAPGTHAATSKATPVDADELPLVDSAASNVLKKLTLTNLKAFLKTYFDNLYAPVGGGSGAFMATDTLWDAAGDLAVGTGSNAGARLAIGAAGTRLKSDGTTAAWATDDGWIEAPDAWTYASGSGGGTATFTISGVDRTAQLAKGTRIKLTQTTVKYFVVIASSFSTNTTVTVTAGTDYTLANASITSPFYSHIVIPQGWPAIFVFAPAVSGLAGGAGIVAQFTVIGALCFIHHDFSGSSSGTTFSFTLPVPTPVASNIANVNWCVNAGVNAFGLTNNSSTTQCDFYPSAALGTWTNSSTRRALGSFTYGF